MIGDVQMLLTKPSGARIRGGLCRLGRDGPRRNEQNVIPARVAEGEMSMTDAARLGDSSHGDRVSRDPDRDGQRCAGAVRGRVRPVLDDRRPADGVEFQPATGDRVGGGITQAAGDLRAVADRISFLQKELPQHLAQFPQPDPFVGLKLPALPALPDGITRRWPPVSAKLLAGDAAELANLPIDHAVGVVDQRGARQRLGSGCSGFSPAPGQYAEIANEPDDDACSGLSPYLVGCCSTGTCVHALTPRGILGCVSASL